MYNIRYFTNVKIDKNHIINLKLVNYIVIIFIICFSVDLSSQVTETPVKKKKGQRQSVPQQSSADSLRNAAILNSQLDTLPRSLPLDSTITNSIKTDTTFSKVSETKKETKIAEGGLDDIIDYGSTDSSFVDLKENQIHLFGNAFVKYKKYDLKAGYIIFDFDNNEASAFQLEDLQGKKKLTKNIVYQTFDIIFFILTYY